MLGRSSLICVSVSSFPSQPLIRPQMLMQPHQIRQQLAGPLDPHAVGIHVVQARERHAVTLLFLIDPRHESPRRRMQGFPWVRQTLR